MRNQRTISIFLGLALFAAWHLNADEPNETRDAATKCLTDFEQDTFTPSDYQASELSVALERYFQIRSDNRKIDLAAVREHFEKLGDDDWRERESATTCLKYMSFDISPELNRLVATSQDPEVQRRVKMILEYLQNAHSPSRRSKIVANLVNAWNAIDLTVKITLSDQLLDEIASLPEEVECRAYIDNDIPISSPIKVQVRTPLYRAIVNGLHRSDSEESYQKLVSFLCRNERDLTLEILTWVGSPRVNDATMVEELLRLAQGADKPVALAALSHLSNWHMSDTYRDNITKILKSLYDHQDPDIALKAAIISCYSGDWSGFPRLKDATKSSDETVRYNAISQLGDCRYASRGKEIVPLLIPYLKTQDARLLEATIQSLGTYAGSSQHIIPFLQHSDRQVVCRAILSLNHLGDKSALPSLRDVLSKSTDEAIVGYARQAIERIEQLESR